MTAYQFAHAILTLLDPKTSVKDAMALLQRLRDEHAPVPHPNIDGPLMPFGKHKGKTLATIAQDNPEYLRWVLENCDELRPGTRADIEQALEDVRQMSRSSSSPRVPMQVQATYNAKELRDAVAEQESQIAAAAKALGNPARKTGGRCARSAASELGADP